MRFAGYAALFGKRDAGRDVIRKGAFVRTLAERQQPIPLFWQHRPEMRIGWVESIAEDAKGLRVIASIDNPDGGAAAAMKAGTVNGLSFGYRARGFTRDVQGRELTDIELFEVSLVSHPMQHAARVHLVAGDGELKFNQRHYRENGQFARAGEGVLFGGGTSSSDGTRLGPASDFMGWIRGEPSPKQQSTPAQNTTREPANKRPTLRSIPNHQLGELSAREESGPRPMPGLVSTGRGDAGGVSYGPWQLATNRRQPQAFLASVDGQPWAHRFAGKAPGTVDFSRTWVDVAQEDGSAFFHAQRRYIGRSHYVQGLRTIWNDTALNFSNSGATLQDVIWSRSVHLGPWTGAFKEAIDLTDRQLPSVSRGSYEWSSRFIKYIYAESGRRNSKGAMVYFTKSPTQWASLANRFVREERAAQAQLAYEWDRK
jgi:uncharacterized protein